MMAALLTAPPVVIGEINKRQLTIDDPKAIEREYAEEGGRRSKAKFERAAPPNRHRRRKSEALKRMLRK